MATMLSLCPRLNHWLGFEHCEEFLLAAAEASVYLSWCRTIVYEDYETAFPGVGTVRKEDRGDIGDGSHGDIH